MLVAFAALLIHPQLSPKVGLSADKVTLDLPAAASVSALTGPADPTLPLPAFPATETLGSREIEVSPLLPDSPLPAPVATMHAPAPVAFLKQTKPVTVSVKELASENRRKQIWWRSLVVASSGGATFDAWTTRRAITNYGAQELNPMLKPFAGNASLYAAIQVGPLVMDYVGRKMMYSRHSWVRRMWWAPQSASFVSSLACGAYNLSHH